MIIAVTGDIGGGKTHFAVFKIIYPAWRRGCTIYSNTLLFFDDKKTRRGADIRKNPEYFIWWERWKWRKKGSIFRALNWLINVEAAEYDPQEFKFWKRNWNLIKSGLLTWLIRPYKRGRIIYFSDLSEITNARHGLIFIDEGSALFDAHNWHYLPDDFANAMRQSRKNGINLVTTTQDLGQIDKAYRRLMQLWFECRHTWFCFAHDPVWFGRFSADIKNMAAYYGSIDDAAISVLAHKYFWITILRRRRYDTNYNVGFHTFRIIQIFNLKGGGKFEKTWAIVPKATSYKAMLKDIADFQKGKAQKDKSNKPLT